MENVSNQAFDVLDDYLMCAHVLKPGGGIGTGISIRFGISTRSVLVLDQAQVLATDSVKVSVSAEVQVADREMRRNAE